MWRDLDPMYLTECEQKDCIPNTNIEARIRGFGVRQEDAHNQSERHTVDLGVLCQRVVCFQAMNVTSFSCAGVLYDF